MQYFGSKMGDDKDKVMKKILKRIDKNKDGKLDVDEFTQLFSMVVARSDLVTRAKHKFDELDTDKSGFLEEKEIDQCIMWTLQAFPNDDDLQTYKKHLLHHIDSNGDGKLDLGEFVILFEDLLIRLELIERARGKFNELDTDKSGMLEKAELDKVADWVLAAYGERPEAEIAGFKATLMNRIDVNHDGKLSLQEFAVLFDEICARMDLIAQAKKAFGKLDADGSGFLEKEELGKVLVFWAEKCGARIGIDPKLPLDELLAKLDANSDGKLSLSEFVPLFEDVTVQCGMWAIPE
jgi:Ca2+-binding EF-hand superfamily protein